MSWPSQVVKPNDVGLLDVTVPLLMGPCPSTPATSGAEQEPGLRRLDSRASSGTLAHHGSTGGLRVISQVKMGLLGIMLLCAAYMVVLFVDDQYVRWMGTEVEGTVTAVWWENPGKNGSDAVLQVTYETPDGERLLAELRPSMVLDRPTIRQTKRDREAFDAAVIGQPLPVLLHPRYPTLAVSSNSSPGASCSRSAAPVLLLLTGTFFVVLLFQEQRERPRYAASKVPPADA